MPSKKWTTGRYTDGACFTTTQVPAKETRGDITRRI